MNDYFKIGRLRMPVAKKIGVRCSDIYINKNHLAHIAHVHATELSQLGVSAMDYVSMIATRYNMILQGTGSSLLLVVYRGENNDVAAIDLNYSTKKGFWEVKTAQPRRYEEIAKKKKLWQSCPSSQ
ncbi:MAG: hypothetical protein IJL48_07210 [Bacteroidales bacterium]|nr:hypothetical protein [Bacteroidales bacterium]